MERHGQFINAKPGLGSSGQSVIYTTDGTIIWTSTGRVYSPNGNIKLQAQLRVIFEPFEPKDDARTYFGVDGTEDSDAETVASLAFDVA